MYDYKSLDIINQKAIYYANELWEAELNIPLKRNNRFSRSLGRYLWENDEGVSIEISGRMFVNDYNELTIDSVLIHELCHWYSHISGSEWNDSSKAFQELVVKCGGSLCKEIKPAFKAYYGKCPKCGKEYRLYGYRADKKSTYTGCCGKGFEISRVVEHKDKYIPKEFLIGLNTKFQNFYSNKISAKNECYEKC